jgi:hypothetical protein
MHVAELVLVFAFAFVLGTIFGRKIEQKIVGTVLAEYQAAGRISVGVMAELHSRLAYLRKYVGSKISG